MTLVNNKYGTKSSKKLIEKDIASWRGLWETRQQMELLHSGYDTQFLSWYDYENYEYNEMIKGKKYLGSMTDIIGHDKFKEQSIDEYGHLTAQGHQTLYDGMANSLKEWL